MHKLVCFSLDFSKKGAKFVSVLTYLGVLGPAKTPSFDSKTLLLGAKPVVSEINPNLQRKGGGEVKNSHVSLKHTLLRTPLILLASLTTFSGPQVSPMAPKWHKIAELSGLRPASFRSAAGVARCDATASHCL